MRRPPSLLRTWLVLACLMAPGLACAAVVVADPWALGQAGFWLSFVAVAGLFATDTVAVGARRKSVRGRFLSLLREQWVVTLALAPLGLLLFGQVSLVGLLANYTGFLAPKLALFSNIGLMVAVLMWRPQGLYPLGQR